MKFIRTLWLCLVVFIVYCAQNAIAFPRDVSIARTEEIKTPDRVEEKQQCVEKTDFSTTGPTIPEHYELHCEYEEATEDTICQEHCLPKGYNFGLCVAHKCSCV